MPGSATIPGCLHCVILRLVQDWVECGCDEPGEALMRLTEAVGTIVGAMPEPEWREAARRQIAQLILVVSEKPEGNA